MLQWPLKLLRDDPFFDVHLVKLHGCSTAFAYLHIQYQIGQHKPDLALVLGDRFEIMAAVLACHLDRVQVAHLCGGDVTEGSYDDAMRDAISRMASVHFVTSTSAMARLTHMGMRNVHLVGSPGIDYIKHADWKKERPIKEPYVVVSYQPETLDGTNEIQSVIASLPAAFPVFIMPNRDRGSEAIRDAIMEFTDTKRGEHHDLLPYDEYLNLIHHCDELIGNSSSMVYEAPELGVKTRMIGKRQRGRVIPWGDGHASERIVKTLKYTHL